MNREYAERICDRLMGTAAPWDRWDADREETIETIMENPEIVINALLDALDELT